MARQVNKLNMLAIKRTLSPGRYGDGGGLYLQVSKTGSRSWIFKFSFGGRRHDMGLGSFQTVTLAEARQKALEMRRAVMDGENPIMERRTVMAAKALEQAKALTFDQCAAAYIAAHRSSWKNAKHVGQWENTLATYATPVLGRLPVALVDTALVVKVLSPIWESKTETATRLRGRIESILGWATVSGYRTGDNPARWKGHLENLLANIGKTKRVTHHPALPWKEMPSFMPELRQQAGMGARALEFVILTAARSGEVRGACWSEIDFEAGLWIVPGERMKAGREHRVPLSTGALAVLGSMPRMGDLVFPGTKPGKGLSDMSLTAVLRRMNRGDITVHGFRSTFRDWSAEATNHPREVCEHALAHSLPDKVEAAYRRGDLIEKRRALMEEWSEVICAK